MAHALYSILNKFDEARLSYTLGRHRADTILVCVTFVGLRVEVDVFNDGHMEVSCFRGDESIEGDVELISRLIEGSSDRPIAHQRKFPL
jgi:hypothetical protein